MTAPLTILQSDNLKNLYGIRHAFFGRTGGFSQGLFASLNCGLSVPEERENAINNRGVVAHYFEQPPQNLITCWQTHSIDVVTVTDVWTLEDRPKADAMVTREKNIVLGILTADCVPVLFADERAGVIGAAHAGWRGAVGGILTATIETMEKLGATRANIRAAIGPCIWQDSYEVSEDFLAPFLAQDPSYARFFRAGARAGHHMFDLPGYVTARLELAGIASIAPSPADTCADEARFFSYRRNCLNGETRVASGISTIMLRD